MAKLKVCVINSRVFPVPLTQYGGLEQVAWIQAKELAARDYQVTLITPDGSTCPGVDIVSTGPPAQQYDEQTAYGRPDGGYWPTLLQQDLIIDHSWNKWAYMLKAEKEASGQKFPPVLGWLHAPVNTMFGSLPPVAKPSMVCISKDQAAHCEALFGRPARHCYNGIDLDYYKPTGALRTNRFLFLARFSTIKGPDIAIRACKEAGAELDLIGDTQITGEPQYLEQCKSLCDGQQIALRGPCTRGESVTWYNQAHVFVHPTKNFREPFGLAPVEAQACGVPVIAWNYGACKETIKHRETGFLVDTYEQLVGAIGSCATVSNNVRSRCREWASQFSIKNSIDRVEELIKEAVDTGGW